MADHLTSAERSRLMAKVRGHGNRSTELRLIHVFRETNISGWRRHYPLPGKPDFVFPELRLTVFVDGCFWHGCPLHGVRPRKNAGFWRLKIDRNQARDRQVGRLLRRNGWHVLRIWEHALARRRRTRLLGRLRLMGATCGSPGVHRKAKPVR